MLGCDIECLVSETPFIWLSLGGHKSVMIAFVLTHSVLFELPTRHATQASPSLIIPCQRISHPDSCLIQSFDSGVGWCKSSESE